MGYQALLFCPDEKLARVVSQVFSEVEFSIDAVNEPFAAVKKLIAQHYDAVVVDCENEQNTSLLFKSARNSSFNQGSLAIALVEGQAGVAKAYRIGANLVLTKPINVEQAKGTLRVARGLLKKTSDAALTTATIAPPAPAAKTATAPVPATTSPSIPPASRSVVAAAQAEMQPVPADQPEIATQMPAMAASAVAESAVMPPASIEPMIEERIESKPLFSFDAKPRLGLADESASPSAPAPQLKTPVLGQSITGGTLFAAEEARNAQTKTVVSKPAVVAAFNAVSSFQSATAAAPAPARETGIPEARIDVGEKDAAQQHGAEVAHASEVQTSLGSSATPSDGPSFAGLGEQDAAGSGASKKLLIVAVIVLAIAAAGYFGWTRFGQTHSSASPQPSTQPQPADSGPRPMSAPDSAPAPGATDRANVTSSPVTLSASAATPTPSGASSVPRIAIDSAPAPEVKKTAQPSGTVAAPILVKAGTSEVRQTQAKADESAPQAPSPLAVAPSGSADLASVVSSPTADTSTPTLAKIRVSQGVSQGLLIKKVPPKYPPSARASRIQGAVQIEATISKDGSVVNPKVLTGDPMLAAAALEAVRQWRYKPYFLDREPVEIQTQITINFKAD